MDWIDVKERLPNKEELERSEHRYFLCRVIIPDDGVVACKMSRIIKYSIIRGEWDCTGMIITHWMPLPQPPNEM